MGSPPGLSELQRRMAAIFSPQRSPRTAHEFDRAANGLGVRGDDRLSGGERLKIYGDMIFIRFRDVIAEDFPATRKELGDEAWEEIARNYLASHPSTSPDLRLAGRSLPLFLRKTESPRVADLAELELALADSFSADDAQPLDEAILRGLSPEQWPSLQLWTVPSLRLLAPSTPSDRNRRVLLGLDTEADESSPDALCVWRREFRVFEKRLTGFQAAALKGILQPTTFESLCEWLDGQEISAPPAEEAIKLLTGWLRDELVEGSV